MLMTDPRAEPVQRRGLIDGRWLHGVELPVARAFSRGYDRVTVDGLLDECADTIDDLTFELHYANEELATLRRQARTRAVRRGGARVRARRSGHAGRRRRPRIRRAVPDPG